MVNDLLRGNLYSFMPYNQEIKLTRNGDTMNFLEMLRSMGKILDEPNVGIQTLRLMESIKHNKIRRWECILITSCLKELHSLIVKYVLILMKSYSLFEVWQKIISVWVYCDLLKIRRRKKLIGLDLIGQQSESKISKNLRHYFPLIIKHMKNETLDVYIWSVCSPNDKRSNMH